MAIIKKTFLHFFDIHFLEEKGVQNIPRKIFYEAFFATRFALLCSDKVFIPAASYFESPTCKKIVDQYLELVPHGLIWLIGKAHSYKEFCQNKLFQYSNHLEYLNIYESALKNELNFPFYRRKRSSTKDIKSSWIAKLSFSEVPYIFDDCHGFLLPDNIEKKWSNVPQYLENNAFIVPNIISILFSEKINNLAVINTLYEIINKSYFKSYISELNASIVTDTLPFLK
jgi:hypothetical protein